MRAARGINRGRSPSSSWQLDRLSPNERGRDPRSSGEEEDENMLQKIGLLAFIAGVGTNDGLTHNLVVVGPSPTRPTPKIRCAPEGICWGALGSAVGQVVATAGGPSVACVWSSHRAACTVGDWLTIHWRRRDDRYRSMSTPTSFAVRVAVLVFVGWGRSPIRRTAWLVRYRPFRSLRAVWRQCAGSRQVGSAWSQGSIPLCARAFRVKRLA